MKNYNYIVFIITFISIFYISYSEIRHEVIFFMGNKLGPCPGFHCSKDYVEYMKNDYTKEQIIVDDILIYDNIMYFKDSIPIIEETQKEYKSKFAGIDLILLIRDKFNSTQSDTVYINFKHHSNSKYFRINSNYYYDENNIIHDAVSFHFPCYLLRHIGKKCY